MAVSSVLTAEFPRQMLIVRKFEQNCLATQIIFQPHPGVLVQLISFMVSRHPTGATHPTPLVIQPFWY